MKALFIYLISGGLFLVPTALQGQTLKERYVQETGNHALLYHGKLETGYARGYVNTPYYPQEYVEGSIVFQGFHYENVPMRLDCLERKMVMRTPDGKYNIQLLPSVLPRVTLGDRDYVYFSKADKAPDETYFAALYETETWGIYKQHYISNVNEDLSQGIVRKKFSLKQRVYFKKGNKWIVLNGRDDLIAQFKSHKAALKEYCREEKLRPNEKREEDWIKLARYCETLQK